MALLNNFNIMRENYNPSKAPRPAGQTYIRNTSLERVQEAKRGCEEREEVGGDLKIFELPRENIMQAVSIVEWRCQTSLPILRVAHYEVSPLLPPAHQKHTFRSPSPERHSPSSSAVIHKTSIKISEFVEAHPEVSNYELRVRAEEVQWRLSEVGLMPFSQALHLLREMLIGFQALFDIFGAFEPKEGLVGVNSADQWRMWIDEDYCSSFKNQISITEKQFIYRVVLMTEKHSLQTVQSRLFFGAAKQSTYANDCSFIKMLQKLKIFIDANRIYIPSKVCIKGSIMKEMEGQKATAKSTLKKIVSQNSTLKEAPFRKRKQSCQPFTAYSKSSVNLVKHTSNQQQLKSYPSCAELKNQTFNTPITPSSPLLGERNLTFQGSCDNWGSHECINQDNSISSIKLINKSPQKRIKEQPLPNLNANTNPHAHPHFLHLNRTQTGPSLMRPPPLSSAQSTPIFYLSRPRHIKKQEHIESPKKAPVKPVSQLNEPAKRANIRKYSEQLVKFKSADTLASKKFQISTISHNLFEQQEQEEVWPQQKEETVEKRPWQKGGQKNMEESKPKGEAGNASSSSQGIIPSSPNNSSSTKQIGTSGEMEEAYRSLKMQDLAPHRKNNQSLIQHHLSDPHSKNMTVSYQFKRPEPQSDSQSEGSSRPPPQWVNKISDLFSDTVSIKQLKGSIRFKGQEEVFEKQHLKDVKLDMLQKFGRSVTLHCDEQQPPVRAVSRHNQYKSMQLIEEELEEVKSYQDDERIDEVTCKSIRSIRSRRQTAVDKEKEISFKDDFLPYEGERYDGGGFNFETQMYSIRAQRPI